MTGGGVGETASLVTRDLLRRFFQATSGVQGWTPWDDLRAPGQY